MSTVQTRTRTLTLLAMALVLAVLLSACSGPELLDTAPPATVGEDSLIGNRWRLEQILVDDQPVSFAIAAPVIAEFTSVGTMNLQHYGPCFSFGSYLATIADPSSSKSDYQLTPRNAAEVSCKGLAQSSAGAAICASDLGSGYSQEACTALLEQQYAAPRHINDTTSYELSGDHLILRGPGVEMTFINDTSGE